MTSFLPGYAGHIDRLELERLPPNETPAHKYDEYEQRPSTLMADAQFVSTSKQSMGHNTTFRPENFPNGVAPPRSEFGLCHRPWACPSASRSGIKTLSANALDHSEPESAVTAASIHPGSAVAAQQSAAASPSGSVFAPVNGRSAAYTQFHTLSTALSTDGDAQRGPRAFQWGSTYASTIATKRAAGSSIALARQDVGAAHSNVSDGLVYAANFRGAGQRGAGFTRRIVGAGAQQNAPAPADAASGLDDGSARSVYAYASRVSAPSERLRPFLARSSYHSDFTVPGPQIAAHMAAAEAALNSDVVAPVASSGLNATSYYAGALGGDKAQQEQLSKTSTFRGTLTTTAAMWTGYQVPTAERTVHLKPLHVSATGANIPFSTADVLEGTTKVYPNVPSGYTGQLPAARNTALHHPGPGEVARPAAPVDYVTAVKKVRGF